MKLDIDSLCQRFDALTAEQVSPLHYNQVYKRLGDQFAADGIFSSGMHLKAVMQEDSRLCSEATSSLFSVFVELAATVPPAKRASRLEPLRQRALARFDAAAKVALDERTKMVTAIALNASGLSDLGADPQRLRQMLDGRILTCLEAAEAESATTKSGHRRSLVYSVLGSIASIVFSTLITLAVVDRIKHQQDEATTREARRYEQRSELQHVLLPLLEDVAVKSYGVTELARISPPQPDSVRFAVLRYRRSLSALDAAGGHTADRIQIAYDSTTANAYNELTSHLVAFADSLNFPVGSSRWRSLGELSSQGFMLSIETEQLIRRLLYASR
jgi:hypothetical protein